MRLARNRDQCHVGNAVIPQFAAFVAIDAERPRTTHSELPFVTIRHLIASSCPGLFEPGIRAAPLFEFHSSVRLQN